MPAQIPLQRRLSEAAPSEAPSEVPDEAHDGRPISWLGAVQRIASQMQGDGDQAGWMRSPSPTRLRRELLALLTALN